MKWYELEILDSSRTFFEIQSQDSQINLTEEDFNSIGIVFVCAKEGETNSHLAKTNLNTQKNKRSPIFTYYVQFLLMLIFVKFFFK